MFFRNRICRVFAGIRQKRHLLLYVEAEVANKRTFYRKAAAFSFPFGSFSEIIFFLSLGLWMEHLFAQMFQGCFYTRTMRVNVGTAVDSFSISVLAFFWFLGSSSKLLTSSGIWSRENSVQDISRDSKDAKKFSE